MISRPTFACFRCRAASSPISPAPTTTAVLSASSSNTFVASATAAEAMDVAARPIAVSVRTRLAQLNAAAHTRESPPRTAPAVCPSSKHSFT